MLKVKNSFFGILLCAALCFACEKPKPMNGCDGSCVSETHEGPDSGVLVDEEEAIMCAPDQDPLIEKINSNSELIDTDSFCLEATLLCR
jgi:hypothetical protein